MKKCPYEWQNGRESFAPFSYNILTVNGAFMVSGRAQMYVSTFLRLFASRLSLVTKWSAVKSAASAVSTAARVKEKKGRERRGERERERASTFLSPVWSKGFLLADENRLSRPVLRRGCTENEIALGSVCIIFRAYRSPGGRFFFHE